MTVAEWEVEEVRLKAAYHRAYTLWASVEGTDQETVGYVEVKIAADEYSAHRKLRFVGMP